MKGVIYLGILLFLQFATAQDPPPTTSLLATQVIFRHGARNPFRPYPNDPYGDENLWPNGFSQINCIGKMECYNLGRFLRLRYDSLINATNYVRKEVHTLSSDYDRNIQSATSVLAGFYPPNDLVQDCDSIVWKDVPVHTIPFEFDNIIKQESPCPHYSALKEELSSLEEYKIKFTDNFNFLIKELSENANFSIEVVPFQVLFEYLDSIVQERYLNLTLPDWATGIAESPQMEEMTLFYLQSLTCNEEMKRLRAGPLLNRILYNFNLTLSGKIGKEDGRKV